MSTIEEVKSRLDIVEIVGESVPLKKAGRNFKALCPFHQEKTPSFVVFPDSQHYHCFGCGAGGDVFNFVMQMENLTFSEALRQLAPRAGVVLRPPTAQEEEADQQRQRLRELNLAAVRFFQHQLVLGDAGALARAYLSARQITEQTIEEFSLGYAPDRWDALSSYLLERGYDESELLTAGVAVEREDGGHYDRFRHRLIIPIRDLQGHVVGFGGRTLAEDRPPKYLNSPQTLLFDKSAVLYGLDQAAAAIRREGYAVLVEGYFDVQTAHQHGYNNVVAPMGTALTEAQVRLLKRFTQRIFLALDADTAGSMATLRGLDVIREAMDERTVPVPTARGLVRFERELDGEVRIVVLPAGRDPDQVIRADPSGWPELVGGALPVMEYVLKRIAQESDLSTAKGKSNAVQRALPLLVEVHDPVERAHYVQRLANLVHVDEQAITVQLRAARPSRSGPRVPPPQELLLPTEEEVVEGYFLALLHRFPRLSEQLPPGVSSLLAREEHRALLEALLGGEEMRAEFAGELRSHLTELARTFQAELDLGQEVVEQSLQECLTRLQILANERQYRQYAYMLAQAEQEGDRGLAREMLQHLSVLSRRRGAMSTPPRSRLYPDLRRHLGEEGEDSVLGML